MTVGDDAGNLVHPATLSACLFSHLRDFVALFLEGTLSEIWIVLTVGRHLRQISDLHKSSGKTGRDR
jgi:hypothetical protein